MRGYAGMVYEDFERPRKDGIPVPRTELEFVADTLHDLIALYAATQGADQNFLNKGLEAQFRLARFLLR